MPLLGFQPTTSTPGRHGHAALLLARLPERSRLIYGLCFAALGFLLLVVLRSAAARRRRRRRIQKQLAPRAGTLPIGAVPAVFYPQQRLWFSEKSRGVNNNYIAAAMSSNHPPEPPLLPAELSAVTVHDPASEKQAGRPAAQGRGGRDVVPFTWSMEGSNGPKSGSMARPSQPPPLTPPTLIQGRGFPFQDRRLSGAVSVVGDLDQSFFDQPNPDYTSSSSSESTSSSTALDTKPATPVTPRRKSYTKVVPIGSPPGVVVTEGGLQDPYQALSSFSPSSFPSSGPILPLAPHASFEPPRPQEIGVKGEIISMTDDSGAGWKRHTRVYGGGVCLACLASGGHHEGGFYGENVRPEDRR